MPNYRKSHWTDGDGIGPKLRGPALTKRMEELATEANEHHRASKSGLSESLREARLAGDALNEARRRMGHSGKWSKWRAANFEGSARTACDYMRIAREWDDPRLVEARKQGLKVDSIASILKVLRGKHPNPKTDSDRCPITEWKHRALQRVIQRVRAELKQGSAKYLELLDSGVGHGNGGLGLQEPPIDIICRLVKQQLEVLAEQFGEYEPDPEAEKIKQSARTKIAEARHRKPPKIPSGSQVA